MSSPPSLPPSLFIPAVGAHSLSISPPSSSGGPCSTSACWSWCNPHLSISYSFVLLLPHTSVSVTIRFYLTFSFLRLLSHAFFLHFSVLLHVSLTSSAWKPLVFLNIWKWDNPTKHTHKHSKTAVTACKCESKYLQLTSHTSSHN